MEDVMLMVNPKFWKMIEDRRGQPRASLEDFEEELENSAKKKKSKPRYKKAG